MFILLFPACKGGEEPKAPAKESIFASPPPPATAEAPKEVKAEAEAEAEVEEGAKEEKAGAPKNTPPEIVSIRLTPEVVYPGTRIKAVAEGSDADGDPVTFYYEWQWKDAVIPNETSDELDTKEFRKGELVTLYVTPFDGKERGRRRWSPTIMIANRPPEITSSPPAAISGDMYVYDVKAKDPDGDKLTFSLEGAPPGMTIDPAAGRIEWKVSEKKGSYSIKVVASDGEARAFQGFTLTVKEQ